MADEFSVVNVVPPEVDETVAEETEKPASNSSRWLNATTYTGVASVLAGVLATLGFFDAEQSTLLGAAVAGLAGGLIAAYKLVRSFRD